MQSPFLLKIQGESKASKTAKSVKYRGVFGTIATMVKTEGAQSLYNGLVAGLQRQMSFASIRIGLYDSVKQFYTPKGSDRESAAAREGPTQVAPKWCCHICCAMDKACLNWP